MAQPETCGGDPARWITRRDRSCNGDLTAPGLMKSRAFCLPSPSPLGWNSVAQTLAPGRCPELRALTPLGCMAKQFVAHPNRPSQLDSRAGLLISPACPEPHQAGLMGWVRLNQLPESSFPTV